MGSRQKAFTTLKKRKSRRSQLQNLAFKLLRERFYLTENIIFMQNFEWRLPYLEQNLMMSKCRGVLAVLLPLAGGFLFQIPKVVLDNFTDAVFYLPDARQFLELVLHYGFIYYKTRFLGILPDALSGHFFREINGIWMLWWGLSVTVSLALFPFFRKRCGQAAGMIAAPVIRWVDTRIYRMRRGFYQDNLLNAYRRVHDSLGNTLEAVFYDDLRNLTAIHFIRREPIILGSSGTLGTTAGVYSIQIQEESCELTSKLLVSP